MIFITVTFTLIFVAYLILMKATHGQLNSFSEGYYKLREDGRDEWIFHLAMVWIAFYMFGLAAYASEISSYWWLFIIGSAGAILVSYAAHYNEKRDEELKKRTTAIIHVIGSIMIMGGGAIGVLMSFGSWWSPIGVIASAGVVFLLYNKKTITNPVYWGEMGALLFITLGTPL